MGTERRAQVRPICSIFERLEPVFGNLKHELANRVLEFRPCSDKSNQKRIALYSLCDDTPNAAIVTVTQVEYLYDHIHTTRGSRDKKEYFTN
jgi:hypothetical protein